MNSHLLSATGGCLLLLTLSALPGRGQAAAPSGHLDSSRAPIAAGSTMPLYLYRSVGGTMGETQEATYQSGGNVYDSQGRPLGKLVDSAGRDIISPSSNGDYRLRSPAGVEIGTTAAPSTTTGVRTLVLHPVGDGWPAPARPGPTPSNGPVTTDQGGTTTGSAISSSIRAEVGGGLSESDQNTTTGTSSTPDTHVPTPSPAAPGR